MDKTPKYYLTFVKKWLKDHNQKDKTAEEKDQWINNNAEVIKEYIINKYTNLNTRSANLVALGTILKNIGNPNFQKYLDQGGKMKAKSFNKVSSQKMCDKRQKIFIPYSKLVERREALKNYESIKEMTIYFSAVILNPQRTKFEKDFCYHQCPSDWQTNGWA